MSKSVMLQKKPSILMETLRTMVAILWLLNSLESSFRADHRDLPLEDIGVIDKPG